MNVTVQFLRWRDVDPAARPFDPQAARAGVEALIGGGRGTDHDELEDAIDRLLLAEHGAWAAGWRWAASEPGGGGPVRGWCCGRDSLYVEEEDDGSTVDRVMAALEEWHGYLVELSGTFAALRAEMAGVGVEESVERAASRLLPGVLERTGADDAWYGTFVSILCWYLESVGMEHAAIQPAVDGVVSGRFESWIAPPESVAAATCAAIGVEVARAAAAPDVRDATSAWRSLRSRPVPSRPPRSTRLPVIADGHERFIHGPERVRDPVRAARMSAALAACRASAARGETLTLARMAEWQALVLGCSEVAFRTTDAFAKGGREWYPYGEKLPRHFERALAEANGTDEPAAVRAARAYLDVCFFHPFPDGNGRAARLALDHVLARAGLALHSMDPIAVVARAASDARGAWCLTAVVEHLAGPRSRPGG